MTRLLLVLAFALVSSRLEAQVTLLGGAALPETCIPGQLFVVTGTPVLSICTTTDVWTTIPSAGGSSVPTGAIILIDTGTCPTGFEEVAGLDGKTILGTLAANKDVGTTGGNDSITPAGTNSGTAIADHASHTHTYTQVVNHTHGFTNVRGATTGGATTARGFTEGNDTSSTVTTQLTADPGGGVASGTTAGPGAALTHTVSTQPVFAGTPADNRSAFTRVIFCRKT